MPTSSSARPSLRHPARTSLSSQNSYIEEAFARVGLSFDTHPDEARDDDDMRLSEDASAQFSASDPEHEDSSDSDSDDGTSTDPIVEDIYWLKSGGALGKLHVAMGADYNCEAPTRNTICGHILKKALPGKGLNDALSSGA